MTPQSVGMRVLCTAGVLTLGITLVITAALGGASSTVGLSGAVPPATATPARSAPPGAGHLSVAEIGSFAAKAGFSGTALAMAIAVALAESGGNPDATDHDDNGTVDRGLWQINSVHTQFSPACDYDPLCAAEAAFSISAGGTDWEPWVTYQHGAEIPFLPEATAYVESAGFGAMSSLGRSRPTAKGGVR
jgi:hypothetical protein